jgi:predicted nucleic acid-binding protein
VLVLDASPLNHFARAGHLATLQKLIAEHDGVTTRAVIGELRQGAERHPEIGDAIGLDWIRVVPCDELRELYLVAQYMNQLGNEERNAGEATVLAWAEAHGAAYVDDQVACNVGRNRRAVDDPAARRRRRHHAQGHRRAVGCRRARVSGAGRDDSGRGLQEPGM